MILDDLVAATRRRMERDMKRAPLEYVMKRAESVRKTELAQAEKGAMDVSMVSFAFEKNLRQPEREKPKEIKRQYSEQKPPRAPKGYVLVESKATRYGYLYFKYVRIPPKRTRKKAEHEKMRS